MRTVEWVYISPNSARTRRSQRIWSIPAAYRELSEPRLISVHPPHCYMTSPAPRRWADFSYDCGMTKWVRTLQRLADPSCPLVSVSCRESAGVTGENRARPFVSRRA